MNSVACMLENAARDFAANIALEDNDGLMTYGELRKQSRRAASFFLKKGLKRGQPVAVFLPKSNACVVSFYGALYCGVPYSPLDFTAPAARIQRTLENLQPPVLIVTLTDDAPELVTGTVDVSEMMGSSIHLHLNTLGKDVIVIVQTQDLKEEKRGGFKLGEKVSFTFGGDVIHLFSKADEKNLEF